MLDFSMEYLVSTFKFPPSLFASSPTVDMATEAAEEMFLEEGRDSNTVFRSNISPSIPTRMVNHSPKKRVVAFSAFLACLSFSIIVCNLLTAFVNDLLRDDSFVKLVEKYIESNNVTTQKLIETSELMKKVTKL